MDKVLSFIKSVNWTLGDFLLELFDDNVHPKSRQASMVKAFLAPSMANIKAIHVVEKIYHHKFSVPPARHEEWAHFFSLEKPPRELGYSQPALSSWFLQLVDQVMQKEARKLSSRAVGLRVRAGGIHARQVRADNGTEGTRAIGEQAAEPVRNDGQGAQRLEGEDEGEDEEEEMEEEEDEVEDEEEADDEIEDRMEGGHERGIDSYGPAGDDEQLLNISGKPSKQREKGETYHPPQANEWMLTRSLHLALDPYTVLESKRKAQSRKTLQYPGR